MAVIHRAAGVAQAVAIPQVAGEALAQAAGEAPAQAAGQNGNLTVCH